MPMSRSSPVEVKVLRRRKQDNQIARNKRSKDTQIPPPIAELVSQRLVELVADLVRAVTAHIGRVVEEVPRRAAREEVAHVLSAGLALGRAKHVEFCRRANDFPVVKFGDDHAADEAREGVQFVEPDAPELGNLRLGDGDTAE
jgi:hypothetical protein